jgi:hypothetical protein
LARSRAREVKVQLSKLERFKGRLVAERATKVDLLDTEYWFAVSFETREQVEAFARWLGPAYGGKYVDGLALASRLGVDVGPRATFPAERPFARRLLALAADEPPED